MGILHIEIVKERLKDDSILKLDVINGLNKAGMAKLKMYGQINVGKIQPNDTTGNLVEVMSCEGGCISGPCVINQQKAGEEIFHGSQRFYINRFTIFAEKEHISEVCVKI